MSMSIEEALLTWLAMVEGWELLDLEECYVTSRECILEAPGSTQMWSQAGKGGAGGPLPQLHLAGYMVLPLPTEAHCGWWSPHPNGTKPGACCLDRST